MKSKMSRNIILIALLGLLSIDKVAAQSVTVEAKIDSLQILIGEQAKCSCKWLWMLNNMLFSLLILIL